MSFSRGPKEPVPEVETTIWVCSSEDCNGWMRESFSFEKEPECPLCTASMTQEVRVLPEVK
ncbi:cold-shock protein [Ornithinibacillus contaminans]|uniref:cold-shock protein n=1 Tax=Ornithinibacillus contaminans TaxID=694055 RepID=UPI00064DA255|nr:cold-shock protein [Ornithinibacillus contaminans]